MKTRKEKIKLSRYLERNLSHHFRNRGELIEIIETIAEATLPIRGLLERGITSREINYRMNIAEPKKDSKNIYDEEQIHEDVLTHSIILKALQESDVDFAFVASEESEPLLGKGNFGITVDPVDGSSNVAVNRTVGTIVGIYDETGEIICSFYVLYGIFTNLILAINGKVAEFLLDTSQYSMTFYHFVFLDELKMPDLEEGGIRCMGGNPNKWTKKCRDYEGLIIDRHFKDRYSGSFVGDMHAVINYGGIYSYFPSPRGKIRLYYEWIPLAFIAKTLGGNFLIIGEGEHQDKTKELSEVKPLTKETINDIHSLTCGGLVGSKKAVNFFKSL
ncbi:MAG: putative Fructose-1,6-bisphosphatase class 1 [Promethearchaeota archaeon]|nr:MAG: putative Fructose-1,6-bisphosphatase class 1 [Candidatus Lokiarchaeota archaeon]